MNYSLLEICILFDKKTQAACNEDVKSNKENPLINLAVNVVAPVFILNKLSKSQPLAALLLALALPLGYGIWSYAKTRKMNMISLLGLLNTLFTGGLAFLKMEGIWFAFKEAGFPFLIGSFVLASSFSNSPFLKSLINESGLLSHEPVTSKLTEDHRQLDLLKAFKKFTLFFSFTFFFSAALNFILAYSIFEKIPAHLTDPDRAEILNQQIAKMTWMGYVVIFAPSIVFFLLIMYFFLKEISKITEVPLGELIKDPPK